MDNQGTLVVVSGFSGAGKGTVMKALISKYGNYALSISATTRTPREGEENGREYFFKTREEFEELKRRLIGRGTEDIQTIQARLKRAGEEADSIQYYDYTVVNDTVENCVETLHALIQSQRNRVDNHREFIAQVQKDVKQLTAEK